MNNTKKRSNKKGNIQTPKSDKRTAKRKTGDLGEDIACKYLLKRGFTILERNYLKKYGEIDIIATKNDIYHFIEVKTVTREPLPLQNKESQQNDQFKPEENVHAYKLKKLSRVIEAYILENKIYDQDWVIDVVTVSLNMHTRRAKVVVFNNITL